MSGTSAPALRETGPRFERYQCIEVACTECDEKLGEDGTLHFGSIAEALTTIASADWEITDDAVRCYDCIDHCDHSATAPVVVHKCEYCWPPLFCDTPAPDHCQCARTNSTVTHVQVSFISRTHPGFTTHSCVALSCGECDEPLADDDEHIPHFRSTDKALADAAKKYDWVVTDVLVCCPQCASKRECVATGHQFPEHPDYTTADGIEVRWCSNCGEPVRNPVNDRDQPWL